MKKKHRDIVVNGVTYGWIADGYNHLRIFKDKQVIAEFDIDYRHDAVTPKMVAALITDPIDAIKWINAEPCPFCGGLVTQHPKENVKKHYYVCYHEEDCWLIEHPKPRNYTHIPIHKVENWNRRN
jgi:hypothetical protein